MRFDPGQLRRTIPILTAWIVCGVVFGCSNGSKQPDAAKGTASGDWSRFSGKESSRDISERDAIPESPIELTGYPAVRSIRLAWTRSDQVPTFEEDHQSLQLPADTLQAVLMIELKDLPDDVDIRVDWFYGKSMVFSDVLETRENGGHYFSLVKRQSGRLEALPQGAYRAVVSDGGTQIKTVSFTVGE